MMCVVWDLCMSMMCVCACFFMYECRYAYVRVHVWSQDKLQCHSHLPPVGDRVYCCLLLHIPRGAGLQTSGESLTSASYLTEAVVELQTCSIMSKFTRVLEMWTHACMLSILLPNHLPSWILVFYREIKYQVYLNSMGQLQQFEATSEEWIWVTWQAACLFLPPSGAFGVVDM